VPLAIDAPPARGDLPGIDAVPPSPAIPGAADMPTSIFAASTVDDGDLDAVREAAEGFDLPVVTVARVGYRISENQVRYYDSGTAAAAARLATTIGGVARDFTGSAADPPPGTLEVYLAGEAAEAPPPPPVASAPAPVAPPPQSRTERLREGVMFHDGTEMTSADVVSSMRFHMRTAKPCMSWVKTLFHNASRNLHIDRLWPTSDSRMKWNARRSWKKKPR